MCAGVEIEGQGKAARVYFPVATAMLPVLMRDGSVINLPWGARREENAGTERRSRWPEGGWARLESIQSGRWDTLEPVAVKIPARGYMEKDGEGHSHWFALEAGEYIQGLVATLAGERRIYVVTISTPAQFAHIHDRWPRIVRAADGSLVVSR
jgi:putative SOS response-associated peptidase YedK